MKSPLLFIGALLVLVLCSALVAPFFVDWSDYRDRIEAYAQEITGRSIAIDGAIDVRLLPSPRIALSEVRLGNVDTAVSSDFLQAEQVVVELSLGPLLRGQLDFASVVIGGAVIELEHMGGGTGNWHVEGQNRVSDLAFADIVTIRSAVIEDSVIFLRDSTREGSAELTDVELQVTAQSLSGPYTVNGTLRHEGVPVGISVATGKRSAGGELRLSVRLTQDGGRGPTYAFDGQHNYGADEASLDGRLTVVQSVAPLSPGGIANASLPFAFRANVKGSLAVFSLEDISLLLDQTDATTEITGSLSTDIGETIEVTAEFNVGHLDLDNLMQRTQLTADALLPDLSIIDGLPAVFDLLPAELDAVLRFKAGALTVSGETVESARFEASYSENVLSVDRLSGRVPGRGQLLVENARYDASLADAGFVGTFELTARDTRGFARWGMPELADWLDEAPRRLRGSATVSGSIEVDGRAIGLTHARLKHRDITMTGNLLFDPGDRPRVELMLDVEALNLDHFAPLRQSAAATSEEASGLDLSPVEMVRESFATLLTDTAPSFARRLDGKLELTVHEMTWRRLRGGRVTAFAELDEGTLSLHELVVRDFNDVSLSANARLAWVENRPQGGVWVELSTEKPEAIVDITGWNDDFGLVERDARIALERLGPAHLGWSMSTRDAGTETRTEFELDGELAGVDLAMHGSAVGAWDAAESAQLDVEGKLLGRSSDALLALFGYGEGAEPDQASRSELVTFSIHGSLLDGAATTFGLNLYDSEVRVEGVTMRAEGATVTRGDISVNSENPGKLYRVLGLADGIEEGVYAPVSVDGHVTADGFLVTVHTLGGVLADAIVGFNGSIDLRSEIAEITGNATVSHASLPWVAGHVLGAKEFTGDQSFQSVVIWQAIPFGAHPFENVALDLALGVGELSLAEGTLLGSVEAQVAMRDNTLSVQDVTAELFGGVLELNGDLENLNGQVSTNLQYALTDAALEQTAADGAGGALLRGRVTSSGEVTASGRSPLGLISSLQGQGELQIEGGTLTGIDPGAFAAAIAQVATPEELDVAIGAFLKQGEMAITDLSTGFAVEQGIVQIAPVEFTSSGARGTGQSQLDLPGWHIRSQWKVALMDFPEAPEFGIVHSGEISGATRDYETAGLRSFLVVRGLTEGVARLEELQRQEAAEVARIQELERRAREEAARRAREEAERLEREAAEEAARQEAERLEREAALAAAAAETSEAEVEAEPAQTDQGAQENAEQVAVRQEPDLLDEELTEPQDGLAGEPLPVLPIEPQQPVEPTVSAEPDVEIVEIPSANQPSSSSGGSGPVTISPEEALELEIAEGEEAESQGGASTGNGDPLFSDNPNDWLR